MLWYKAWLDTRTRFWICLLGITVFCSYRIFDLDHNLPPWAKLEYNYFALHATYQLLSIMWIVAVILLFMGGLLREKASGASSFTLALPVSRWHLMSARIGAGLIQALVLVIVPWAAVFALAALMGRAPSLAQVGFYVVLLVGGGAVFAAVALLVSSFVEGEYTAPLVSFGVVLACFNAPRIFNLVNPLDFVSGHDYLGPSLRLVGPIPWTRLTANLAATAILIALSVKIIQRRDF